MVNGIRVLRILQCAVVCSLLLVLSLSPVLFGEESIDNQDDKDLATTDFDLEVNGELVTLHADNAPLYEIIEELSKLMKIEVVGNIHEEEKVSVDFDKLSLKEALEKLSASYGYQVDSHDGDNTNDLSSRITKIIVLPKGRERALLKTTPNDQEIQENKTEEPKRPEPFKFEFDPSKYLEEGEGAE